MRVALLGNWPPPFGGVAVHVASLARALRSRGHEVAVLDLGTGGHAGAGVRQARGPGRLAAALAVATAERRLVHCHTNGANARSWLVAAAAGRARRPGAPRGVLTLHSGSLPAFLRADARHRALARLACAGFGAVVAVNEEIAGALALAGVDRPVAVLPAFSGEVMERPHPPAGLTAFRERHAPLLAAALAPGPIYGADDLAAAFGALQARLPGAGLVTFGDGTEHPAWNGRGRLGLGEVEHAEALGVLAAADVFVRPTRADGDAITVREALALGCAVVASDVGHRPAACLTYPSGDRPALLARLLDAVRRGRTVAADATDPAGAGFEPLLRIYERLAGGQGPTGARRLAGEAAPEGVTDSSPRIGAGEGPTP